MVNNARSSKNHIYENPRKFYVPNSIRHHIIHGIVKFSLRIDGG